jgi:hypothetical protein
LNRGGPPCHLSRNTRTSTMAAFPHCQVGIIRRGEQGDAVIGKAGWQLGIERTSGLAAGSCRPVLTLPCTRLSRRDSHEEKLSALLDDALSSASSTAALWCAVLHCARCTCKRGQTVTSGLFLRGQEMRLSVVLPFSDEHKPCGTA